MTRRRADGSKPAPSIPEWAAEALRHDASGHVLSAVTIDRGLFKGAVLANTTTGAALVTKRRVGEPIVHHASLAEHVTAFRCDQCSERMELVDPEPPRDVLCSHCGTRYHLDANLHVHRVGSSPPRSPSSRGGTRGPGGPARASRTPTRSKRSRVTGQA